MNDNEVQGKEAGEITGIFPGGWRKGDTCYLITSKARKTTLAYTVESFDGKYFGVRGNTGMYHRVSLGRMFRSREDAVASLQAQTEKTSKRKESHTR